MPPDLPLILSLKLDGLTITEWLETDAEMYTRTVQKRNAYLAGIAQARDEKAGQEKVQALQAGG